MTKRIFSLLLAVCLLAACLPLSASAETVGGNIGLIVAWGGNGTASVTWSLDTVTGEMTISGTGPMMDFDSLTAPQPWRNYSVRKVTVNKGVTTIGDRAFEYCRALTEISLPDGLLEIGDWSFSGCTALKSVTIPKTVTKIGGSGIGGYAFSGCTGLTSVTLENGVGVVNEYAFKGCTALREITIPASVTAVSLGAFMDCIALTTVNLDRSLPVIGASAFSGCQRLANITLPEGLTSLGASAFKGCKTLTSVTVPGGLAVGVSESAFENCTALKTVTVQSGVTAIGRNAFRSCTALTSVSLPDTVVEIGYGAFEKCSGLTSLKLPKNLTFIGSRAFCYCSGLTTLKLPETVSSIGEYAFSWCSKLAFMEIPENVTRIEQYTFQSCPELEKVYIPDSVTVIEKYAFNNWKKLCIYCESGSAAHEYAECFGIPFKFGRPQMEYPDDEPDEQPEPENPFTDVLDEYYKIPVLWAAKKGIVYGTTDTTFSPNAFCTRAQAVTFLWRAAGKPKPTRTTCPFTDVVKGEYYYDAVLWAVEKGITAGATATTFGTNDNCTRAQIVTFLWRYDGKQEPPKELGDPKYWFDDVNDPYNTYYFVAVMWAVWQKITAGTTAKTFSPNDYCTRGQIVTFLYRYMEE